MQAVGFLFSELTLFEMGNKAISVGIIDSRLNGRLQLIAKRILLNCSVQKTMQQAGCCIVL